MTASALMARLVLVHRPDCAMVAEGGPFPAPVVAPDEIAASLGDYEAAAYAIACRPLYEDLRRVVGQLSGLLILVELTRSGEARDLPELAAARDRWRAGADRLGALKPPGACAPHLAQLRACHDACGRALAIFDVLRARVAEESTLESIAVTLRRAYAHLRAATADEAGLSMVDLSHACCSCGR